jgi:hypothetical protein
VSHIMVSLNSLKHIFNWLIQISSWPKIMPIITRTTRKKRFVTWRHDQLHNPQKMKYKIWKNPS